MHKICIFTSPEHFRWLFWPFWNLFTFDLELDAVTLFLNFEGHEYAAINYYPKGSSIPSGIFIRPIPGRFGKKKKNKKKRGGKTICCNFFFCNIIIQYSQAAILTGAVIWLYKHYTITQVCNPGISVKYCNCSSSHSEAIDCWLWFLSMFTPALTVFKLLL